MEEENMNSISTLEIPLAEILDRFDSLTIKTDNQNIGENSILNSPQNTSKEEASKTTFYGLHYYDKIANNLKSRLVAD